jgi:hypothetical protein
VREVVYAVEFCVSADAMNSGRGGGVSGKQFYISTDVDDLDKDADEVRLNTRAWVMQEGILARRTIHFSANQTYWECGEGVRCENLTRLHR